MYAAVISLGAWCQVAEQFRRHNFPRTHSPFEWTVSTWSSMLAVIRDDGRNLGKNIVLDADKTNVRCQSYGLLHPHDFPKNHDKPSLFLDISDDRIEINRSKYAKKMDDFRRACKSPEGRLAFVRMGGEAEPAVAWPYLHDQTPLTSERINELVELLIEYCGHSNFDLFIMLHNGWHPYNETKPLHSNARVVILPNPRAPVDWYGHEDDWRQVYTEVGITPQWDEEQSAAIPR